MCENTLSYYFQIQIHRFKIQGGADDMNHEALQDIGSLYEKETSPNRQDTDEEDILGLTDKSKEENLDDSWPPFRRIGRDSMLERRSWLHGRSLQHQYQEQ